MELHPRVVRMGHPVLDIGDNMGGVIFFTSSELCWQEIEIAPHDRPDERTHTDVTERAVITGLVYTGVFPPLVAGEYCVCRPVNREGERFTVIAGQVIEIDWRSGRQSSH